MSDKTTVQIGDHSFEVPVPIATALQYQLKALIAARQMQDELVSPNFLMDDAGTGFSTREELEQDARDFFREAPVSVYRQPLSGYRWLGETHCVWRKAQSGEPVLQGVVITCPRCNGYQPKSLDQAHCTNCGGGGEIVSLGAVPDHFSTANQSGAH